MFVGRRGWCVFSPGTLTRLSTPSPCTTTPSRCSPPGATTSCRSSNTNYRRASLSSPGSKCARNSLTIRARLHQASASVILFSLKTMELLQNGVASHFGGTALFSIRPVLLASSQHCRSIDADAQCKWILNESHRKATHSL